MAEIWESATSDAKSQKMFGAPPFSAAAAVCRIRRSRVSALLARTIHERMFRRRDGDNVSKVARAAVDGKDLARSSGTMWFWE